MKYHEALREAIKHTLTYIVYEDTGEVEDVNDAKVNKALALLDEWINEIEESSSRHDRLSMTSLSSATLLGLRIRAATYEDVLNMQPERSTDEQ